ncbi:helix-turn-helix transcriptional regulator [Sphingomonas glaciei]|uniref:Helix-turn-helix domain-containing protein n=1 Tax=Sphingomonas glaciei TaxID=2938948 RepID=A0ABY5MW77_9SPHN|nr:helix-turn-helix domain-containing protein [Sphingomonas glaciei]UUR08241.1 helix-turn-helix domain-containing protein [Sphingomonas glaciei]
MPQQSFEELCELFAYQPKGRPLDSEEAAEVLRIHPGTMAQYRLRGEGPRFFSPPGTRRVWYAEKDLLAWIASGAKRSTSETVAA